MAAKARETCESDIGVIASAMRLADVAECAALGFADPWEALRYSWTVSRGECWTALIAGAPAALFGVAEYSSGVGSPWLLGTPAVDGCSGFVRLPRDFLGRWLDRWPVLANYVDARNAASVRWLEHLGFTLAPAAPHGPSGLLFHRFEMRR